MTCSICEYKHISVHLRDWRQRHENPPLLKTHFHWGNGTEIKPLIPRGRAGREAGRELRALRKPHPWPPGTRCLPETKAWSEPQEKPLHCSRHQADKCKVTSNRRILLGEGQNKNMEGEPLWGQCRGRLKAEGEEVEGEKASRQPVLVLYTGCYRRDLKPKCTKSDHSNSEPKPWPALSTLAQKERHAKSQT